MADLDKINTVIDALETALIIHPEEKLLRGEYRGYAPVADIVTSIGPLIRELDLEEFKRCDLRVDCLLRRYD
jgi:hypothetical protein